MSAKRQKVERQLDPSGTFDDLHLLPSEASTAVKSEDEELLQEKLEHHDDEEDEDEELPPYHEFHHLRNLRSTARQLMQHSGLDLDMFGNDPDSRLLNAFFQRYNPLDGKKSSVYWKFSYEQSQWPMYGARAILTAHSLNGRQFKGDWCGSWRLAEKSAIKAFREDQEIVEIAKRLPPTLTRIREIICLRKMMTKEEKSSMEAEGIDPRDVVNEIVHLVYMYFRDFGCRTALWDGNT